MLPPVGRPGRAPALGLIRRVNAQEPQMTLAPPLPRTESPPPPSGALLPRDDATRRAELKMMKRVATGLLGVALVVFVVARILEPSYPWLGFVRATAEASLVGGLADWFAVTALFRK